MKLLENKTVVVTGAMGALGRKVCSVAESHGARVIRLDIASDGECADSHAVDLTDLKATQQCIAQIGPIDALVNLAGGFAMGQESWESSDEEWELMFKLNVATMRNAIKATVPQMLEQQGGSIVNVGAYGAREGQGLMGAHHYRYTSEPRSNARRRPSYLGSTGRPGKRDLLPCGTRCQGGTRCARPRKGAELEEPHKQLAP